MRNEKQILAIEHFTGPCLVIAGPGSGKTKCLVERVCNLIESHQISPEKILVLTFTKDAANEMKNRFVKQSSFHGKTPFFGTFHSFFFQILKEEYHFSNQNILNTKTAVSLLKEALSSCHIPLNTVDCFGVLKEISACLNKNISADDFESRMLQSDFSKVFFSYQSLKDKHNLIDFDDMQSKVYDLLSNHEDVLDKWQNRYLFVLLDEVQDINSLQFDITNLLVKKHQNLYAVGDDDQSIYAFRGSVPRLMMSFEKIYPNLKTIVLNTNYRSKKQIVSVASKFIEHNGCRFSKEYESFSDNFGTIKYLQFEDECAQANYISDVIRLTKGKTIGILFRNKKDGDYISRFLEWNHIPYYAKERFYYQNTNEILLDVINYLSNKKDDGYSLFASINMYRKGLGYESYLKKKYENDPITLEVALSYLDELQNECKKFSKNISVSDVICHLKKMEMKELYRTKTKEETNVFLYTYHGSKGLEFDMVFCIDVNEGIVPSPYCNGDVEEERRMFYVAITRAKSDLYISCIKIRGGKTYSPSVFINEMKY